MEERRCNQLGERELDDPFEESDRLCEQIAEINQGIASLSQQPGQILNQQRAVQAQQEQDIELLRKQLAEAQETIARLTQAQQAGPILLLEVAIQAQEDQAIALPQQPASNQAVLYPDVADHAQEDQAIALPLQPAINQKVLYREQFNTNLMKEQFTFMSIISCGSNINLMLQGNFYACTRFSGQHRYHVLLNDRRLFQRMECFSLVDKYERVVFVQLAVASVRRADTSFDVGNPKIDINSYVKTLKIHRRTPE